MLLRVIAGHLSEVMQQRDYDTKRPYFGNGTPDFQRNTHDVIISFLSADGRCHLSISERFYRLLLPWERFPGSSACSRINYESVKSFHERKAKRYTPWIDHC